MISHFTNLSVLIMSRVFRRIKDDCQKCTELATKPNLISLWRPKHSLAVISKLSNLFLPVMYSSFQWKPLCLQTRSQKVWHQFQKLQNFKWQFLSNLVRNLIILKIFSLKLFYLHQQEKNRNIKTGKDNLNISGLLQRKKFNFVYCILLTFLSSK